MRDRIDLEVSRARDHWNLLKAINEATSKYAIEMNESRTFWHLTINAHRDVVASYLGRLYDQTKGTLSLARFLAIVKANKAFFSDVAFRERLKNNSHVEILVKDRDINDADLDAEVRSVTGSDPLVKELWKLRCLVTAHTDADVIRRDAPEADRRWLPPQSIETLLNRAAEITGKYSLYYKASRYGEMVGANDFESTFRWMRKAIRAHEAKIEKEFDKVNRNTEG